MYGERHELYTPAIARDFFVYMYTDKIFKKLIFGHLCVSIRLQGWAFGHQAKNGTNGSPGPRENCFFSRDTSLKIGTVPENPGRMVALLLRVYSVGPNKGEGFTILAFSLATTANVVTWSFQAGNCPKFIHHGPLTR